MNVGRAAFSIFVMVCSGLLAADERLRFTNLPMGTPTSSIVVRGEVDFVRPPFGIVLVDGTEIEIDRNTEWAGANGVADLAPGDELVVAGRQPATASEAVIKASGIRVVSGSGRVAPIGMPVCLPPRPADSGGAGIGARRKAPIETQPGVVRKSLVELEGVVLAVLVDGFELAMETEEVYTVVVGEETEFNGIEGLDDLSPGNAVRARGELAGVILTATRVELHNENQGGGNDGGVEFESAGVLIELQPPDRFTLSDQRSYVVDGLTVFDDAIVSYSGLEIGQYLAVGAVYEGSNVYRVATVDYEGERDQGQGYVEIEGIVSSASVSSLSLTDGTVFAVTPLTIFNGDANRPEDVQPGWYVVIYALRNLAGNLVARSVRAEDLEPASTIGQEYEPREAVLILAAGAAPDAVAERYDATVSGEIIGGTVLFRWERDIDDDLLAQLEADPDVDAVEPNFLFRDPESTRRRFVIVDLSPSSEEYTRQPAAVRHKVAQALSFADGSGTIVAVMDTGVDHCHELLAGHLLGGGLDLVDGDLSPWETQNMIDEDGDGEVDEAVGHGTFVASLVALAAPGAMILPYRVLDDDGGGTAFNLALALADAIERGVDVINLSLAYHERSVVVDLLLEEASRRGIVVVAAAGNDGLSTLPFPASDSHVLAVTALRSDATGLADFANRDAKAVVAVIGEDVYGGLYGGVYGTSSGTSLAAPFAAAGAALAKGLDPAVAADIVRLLLVQSGVPVTDGAWVGRSLDLGQAMANIQP